MQIKLEPITLKEYIPTRIPKSQIPPETGFQLWDKFKSKISVEVPGFKTEEKWELTSLGWVGFLPFSDTLSFYLEPKIPLKNLFGMWEYAYRLKSFEFLQNLYESETLQDFYEQLANVLAKRIIERGRKGYYRTYISKTDDLSFIRGKVDIPRMINKPWEARPRCSFQENTADVSDNQILSWTLNLILRSGYCSEKVLPFLRHGYRNLNHITTLKSFQPVDCIGRFYNRLNQDYQPLHALCRFFLENSGPSYEIGDRNMLPFMVNMAALFELFVAEWLKFHLPVEYELKDQENIHIDSKNNLVAKIDLVIYNKVTHEPLCVLDTKYKSPSKGPSTSDIFQINYYASMKQCKHAILVYPEKIPIPYDETKTGVRIRTSTFSLAGDLEEAGKKFLEEILS